MIRAAIIGFLGMICFETINAQNTIAAIRLQYVMGDTLVSQKSIDISASTQYQQQYSYDPLVRLIASHTYQKTASNQSIHIDRHAVYPISHDLNGNKLAITRNGYNPQNTQFEQIDSLQFSFNANQLQAVQDLGNGGGATQAYQYNQNGNLIYNERKGIDSILYTLVGDRVREIVFNDGKRIQFVYDAKGNRLAQHVVDVQGNQSGVLYADQKEYNQTATGNIQMEAVYDEYGRLVPVANNILMPSISMRDELGNGLVYAADVDGNGRIDTATDILQRQVYYPFGLAYGGLVQPTTGIINKYQYNGDPISAQQAAVENTEQRMLKIDAHGLDEYHAFFRSYDPSVGQWYQQDPKAIDAESPYVAMRNTPNRLADRLGDYPYQNDPKYTIPTSFDLENSIKKSFRLNRSDFLGSVNGPTSKPKPLKKKHEPNHSLWHEALPPFPSSGAFGDEPVIVPNTGLSSKLSIQEEYSVKPFNYKLPLVLDKPNKFSMPMRVGSWPFLNEAQYQRAGKEVVGNLNKLKKDFNVGYYLSKDALAIGVTLEFRNFVFLSKVGLYQFEGVFFHHNSAAKEMASHLLTTQIGTGLDGSGRGTLSDYDIDNPSYTQMKQFILYASGPYPASEINDISQQTGYYKRGIEIGFKYGFFHKPKKTNFFRLNSHESFLRPPSLISDDSYQLITHYGSQ